MTGSRSCGSSKSGSSRGACSCRHCSSNHHAVRPSQCRQCHKSLRPGRRVCRSMVRRPRHGSVQERPLLSWWSQGGQMVWWRLLA